MVLFSLQQIQGVDDRPFGRLVMEPEVDLESYQSALERVLSWLLSAEDALQSQGAISDNVEDIKEQFHTHEVSQRSARNFCMPITFFLHSIL